MNPRFRRWWPWLKWLLVVAVVVGVCWHLLRILQSEELNKGGDARTPAEILWDAIGSANAVGVLFSGVFYLTGLAFCAWFWIQLTRSTSESLPLLPAVRGYYISHLGKYAPGKGWALVMRTAMAARAGCRPAVAVLTAVYETLTTMAAGALLAATFLLFQKHQDGDLIWKALALLALAGVPILPGVFNRVVEKVVRRVLRGMTSELPRVPHRSLPIGLLLTSFSWLFLGASLEALLWSMYPETFTPTVQSFLRSTTYVAVSYVAGFIASTPGGLGVREFFLQQFLAPQLGAQAVVVALLLRLLWTVAEVVFAALVWWLPKGPVRTEPDLSKK